MNLRFIILGIFIGALSASANDSRNCELKSTAKIEKIESLRMHHRIGDDQLDKLLSEAYDDEASEVIACLRLRKWRGISAAVIRRVQLTWEGNCARIISGLEIASDYSGGKDAELLGKIDSAKANCAWTHDLLSRALNRAESRGDSAWERGLMLHESQAMAF